MKSPFPGVDPFIEGQHYWQDFHLTFINFWRSAINQHLPEHYEARFEEHVEILQVESDLAQLSRPDISVVRLPGGAAAPSSAETEHNVVATLEPAVLPIPVFEEVRERWIEIRHRPDREIVAVLELLSPSNKEASRGQYLAKRAHFHTENVHLVEVDLLLAGTRLPMGAPLPPGDFYAIIARADRRPKAEVYAWTLRDKLPTIPIPLLKPDKDIFIDLSHVYAQAFADGRYDRSIDYTAALKLPMQPHSRVWAQETAKSTTTSK